MKLLNSVSFYIIKSQIHMYNFFLIIKDKKYNLKIKYYY